MEEKNIEAVDSVTIQEEEKEVVTDDKDALIAELQEKLKNKSIETLKVKQETKPEYIGKEQNLDASISSLSLLLILLAKKKAQELIIGFLNYSNKSNTDLKEEYNKNKEAITDGFAIELLNMYCYYLMVLSVDFLKNYKEKENYIFNNKQNHGLLFKYAINNLGYLGYPVSNTELFNVISKNFSDNLFEFGKAYAEAQENPMHNWSPVPLTLAINISKNIEAVDPNELVKYLRHNNFNTEQDMNMLYEIYKTTI